MMNEKIDRGRIGKEIKKVLEATKVSKNIFTSRPNVTDAKMNDFIIIRLPNNLNDLYACGEAIGFIEVHAKTRQDGSKNDPKMTYLMETIGGLFPIESGGYYFDSTITASLGIDDYGFSAEAFVVEITITI